MSLTVEQQRLINMYVSQYNQTNTHIDRLLESLDDIRNNIQSVLLGNYNYNYNYSRQNRANRFNRGNYRYTNNTNNYSSSNYLNSYINNLINDRSGGNVFPINESAYTRIFNRVPQNNTNTNTIFNNFLNSTVAVLPTAEQIGRATHSVRYGDIPNPLSLSCPISLEPFNDNDMVRQIRYCEHVFSESQITQWFNNNVRCPVCRYDIRNYVSDELNNETNEINETNETNENIIEEPRIDTPPTPIPRTNSLPNIVRNPVTNQIDQLSFDITGSTLANNLLQNFTSQIFQTLLSGGSTYDASNNMFWDVSHNIFVDPSFNTILFDAISGSFNNNI